MSVTFITVDPDSRFQFHNADGTEVVVDASGLTTDDPNQISYLDGCPFVQRTKKGAGS